MTAALLAPGSDPRASKLKVHWLPAQQQLLLPLRLVRHGRPLAVERVVEEVDVVAAFDHGSRCGAGRACVHACTHARVQPATPV
jgi:hypothetical protein